MFRYGHSHVYLFAFLTLACLIGPKIVKRSSLPSLGTSGKSPLPHIAVNSPLIALDTRDSTNLSATLEDGSGSGDEDGLVTTMGDVESVADESIHNFQQTQDDAQGAH